MNPLRSVGMRLALTLTSLLAATAVQGQVTTFTGVNFNGSNLNESGFIPPDTQGAVGINHYVEALNGRVRMYTKDGGIVVNESLNTFFSTRVGLPVLSTFDPRVLFDRTSARWVLSADDNSRSASSNLLMAFSKTSNPTTAAGWNGTNFDMDSSNLRWADFDTVGFSRDWVTIQNNMFSVSTSSPVPTTISLLTIPKASLLAGNTTGAQYLNNLNGSDFGFTAHPVTDLGFGGQSANAYTISAFNGSTLRLSTLSSAVNTPSYTGTAFLSVSGFSSPVNAPQSGSANLISGNDNRIGTSPTLVNGTIWVVQKVSESGVNRIRLYRIDPATNAVLSQITVPVTAGLFTLFPSVAANPAGDVVVGFSGSNAAQFVGAYTITGRFDGTNFTWGTEQLNAAGVGSYFVDFGSGRNRWGDYSATTLDPTDPGIFWSSQEFVSAVDVWTVKNTELIPTRAGEIRRQVAANANFATAATWINGVVPTSTDHVIFSRWGQTNFTTTLPASAVSLDRLSVRQTGFTTGANPATVNAIFAIPAGGMLTLTNGSATTPSLAVAEFAGQAGAVFNGPGALSTQTTIVAGGLGSVGVLAVNTTWANAGDVFIGGTSTTAGGIGTLNIDNGAAATIAGTVNVYNASTGTTANRVNLGATAAATLTTAGLTNLGADTVLPIVNLATAGSVLAVNGSTNSGYAGSIVGLGSFAKSGSGTLTLTGTNSYTGATNVSAGTLSINGNQVNATGAVTVTGGTLGGSGTVGGPVAVNSGGILGAGNSIGTLTVNHNVTINSGGRIRAELGAGSTADLLNLSGGTFALNLKNGSLLSLVAAGFNASTPTTFLLADLSGTGSILLQLESVGIAAGTIITNFTSTGGITGTNTNVVGDVDLELSGFALTGGDSLTISRNALGDFVVVFAPVPEPASVLGATLSVALAASLIRRFRGAGRRMKNA